MSEILGTLFKYLMVILGAVAVVALFYMTLGQDKTHKAVSSITQLQANTQALFSTQTSFSGLSSAVAITGGLAPSDMISGSDLINPWGGAVTIAVNPSVSSRFDITTTNIPDDSCSKLASILGAAGSSATALAVNGTALSLPVSVAAVVAACNSTTNSITITSGR
jgi:type II secretory pathway pseudopilin PulG